jgi:hypothetical protein
MLILHQCYSRPAMNVWAAAQYQSVNLSTSVCRSTVVTLARVLHDQFPIRALHESSGVCHLGIAQPVRLEHRLEFGPEAAEFRRIVTEADEDQPDDGLDPHRPQLVRADIEVILHTARFQQLAAQIMMESRYSSAVSRKQNRHMNSACEVSKSSTWVARRGIAWPSKAIGRQFVQ